MVDSGKPGSGYEVLNWDQVGEMQDNGIEFGSHTLIRRLLPQLSVSDRKDEIQESRKELEAFLGREVSSFCCPEGRIDEQTVRDAGYSHRVVTDLAEAEPYGPLALRRVGVYYHVDITIALESKCKDLHDDFVNR